MPALERRRKALVVLLTILAAVLAVAVISDVFELRLLNRIARGDDFAASEASHNDTRQGIIGIIQFLTQLTVVVLFIRWMHYAYTKLDPSLRRYKTWWAIGGWFIPIVWLFRPKQIINDLAESDGTPPPSLLLFAWWFAWLMSCWVGNVYLRELYGGDSAQEVHDTAVVGAVCDAASLIAAVLAIFTVRVVTRRVRRAGGTVPAALWTAPERPAGLAV